MKAEIKDGFIWINSESIAENEQLKQMDRDAVIFKYHVCLGGYCEMCRDECSSGDDAEWTAEEMIKHAG